MIQWLFVRERDRRPLSFPPNSSLLWRLRDLPRMSLGSRLVRLLRWGDSRSVACPETIGGSVSAAPADHISQMEASWRKIKTRTRNVSGKHEEAKGGGEEGTSRKRKEQPNVFQTETVHDQFRSASGRTKIGKVPMNGCRPAMTTQDGSPSRCRPRAAPAPRAAGPQAARKSDFGSLPQPAGELAIMIDAAEQILRELTKIAAGIGGRSGLLLGQLVAK